MTLVSKLSRLRWVTTAFIILLFLSLVLRVTLEGKEGRSRDYFRFSSEWVRHWPIQPGLAMASRLWAPLSAAGIIGPTIYEVQPGIHLYIDGDDWVGVRAVIDGSWEREEWGWIAEHLKPGSVFVDIGAHIGTYSQRAAKAVGDQGLVIAVEPNPPTIAKLEQGIAASGWKNIRVMPVACGDRRTRLTLFEAPATNTGMTSFSMENAIRWGGDGSRSVEVDVVPLDEIFPATHAQRLDVIKIDTEGAETMVLRGSAATIAKYHPAIMVETVQIQLHAMKSSVQELNALLVSYGYSKIKANKENALWIATDVK